MANLLCKYDEIHICYCYEIQFGLLIGKYLGMLGHRSLDPFGKYNYNPGMLGHTHNHPTIPPLVELLKRFHQHPRMIRILRIVLLRCYPSCTQLCTYFL